MSIKVELGLVVVAALAALAVFHAKKPLEPQPAVKRMSTFIADDYAAFDRDFSLDGDTCKVGLEQRKMCFTPSPLQANIIEGQVIPSNVPVLAAEFPILIDLPVKEDGQKLLRYGTTLALINAKSRIVEDVLHIDAATFADASRAGQTELVTTAEDWTAS